jgi:hypothetical protein
LYSHGILIPVIAASLVWQRLNQIERMSFGGSWAGLTLVLFGTALGVMGKTLDAVHRRALFGRHHALWTGAPDEQLPRPRIVV